MKTDELEKQISEEFEKWAKGQCFTECLDRDDLEFIENDSGDQFISMNEVDRLVSDITESTFKAAALPLMKEIEEFSKEIERERKAFNLNLATERENIEELQKENEKLRVALKVLFNMTDRILVLVKRYEDVTNIEEAFKNLRTKFNLDKEGGK